MTTKTFKSNDVIYFILAVGDFGRSGRHWVNSLKQALSFAEKGKNKQDIWCGRVLIEKAKRMSSHIIYIFIL